jgi:hypothetical protein
MLFAATKSVKVEIFPTLLRGHALKERFYLSGICWLKLQRMISGAWFWAALPCGASALGGKARTVDIPQARRLTRCNALIFLLPLPPMPEAWLSA